MISINSVKKPTTDFTAIDEDLKLAAGRVFKIGGTQVLKSQEDYVLLPPEELNADATDLPTSLVLVNSLKQKYNAYLQSLSSIVTRLETHGIIRSVPMPLVNNLLFWLDGSIYESSGNYYFAHAKVWL